jgi:hypothetical protein
VLGFLANPVSARVAQCFHCWYSLAQPYGLVILHSYSGSQPLSSDEWMFVFAMLKKNWVCDFLKAHCPWNRMQQSFNGYYISCFLCHTCRSLIYLIIRDLWIFGYIQDDPSALSSSALDQSVLLKNFSCPQIASCRWQGLIHFSLRSLLAFAASSRQEHIQVLFPFPPISQDSTPFA